MERSDEPKLIQVKQISEESSTASPFKKASTTTQSTDRKGQLESAERNLTKSERVPKIRSNIESAKSARRQRDPAKYYLHPFRQPGSNFIPLYEMFICYGHEEYFDCVDPMTRKELNFVAMMEAKMRRMNRQ